MINLKSNYHDMGLSASMGPQLRKEVERQLLRDLNYYHEFTEELSFDWSESCVEGKSLNYLDGSLDRFSGIAIINIDGQMVADGWMDFIYLNDNDQLIIYWDFLDVYIEGHKIKKKSNTGLPEHIKDL